jgi:6-pyruvoyl-tetrahydropterin synthase
MKKYFVIDIDIRSDTKKEKGVVLTDEELNQEIENIISTIDKSDKFRSYSYVVHSGN